MDRRKGKRTTGGNQDCQWEQQSEGDEVPDKFSRPEVLAILREYYEGLSDEDNVKVEPTGHSAA